MNETVLIVDDDPAIVNAIGLVLQKEGCQILKACNSMEASEYAINPNRKPYKSKTPAD